MKYLTVLNYETGRVYQYKVWELSYSDCENYLIEEGHNLSNCEWMLHDNAE